MSETRKDATDGTFTAAILELAVAARRQKGRELSVEELRAYFDGELSQEEEEEVKNQLAMDPEATNTLLGMIAFRKQLAAGSDAEAPDSDWQAMQALLDEETATQAATGPSRPVHGAVLRFWQAAAAILFVTSAGVFFWNQQRVAQLTAQVSDAHRPRINVFQNDLLPVDLELRRDPDQVQTIVLDAKTERYVVALIITDPGEYPDYGVEFLKISAEAEVRVWGARGLVPSALDYFHVEFDRHFLPAGSYRVELFGIAGDKKDLLEAYHMHIMIE